MIEPHTIFHEHGLETSEVLQEVVSRWPRATLIPVDSHWKIPELHGNPELLKRWAYVKRHYLVVGRKKTFTFTPNGRSTDFIGPSVANGCAMACVYCYVARRKGYANPITIFSNRRAMIEALKYHAAKQPPKAANQCDPLYWTYDIGCNNDISIDAMTSDTVRHLVKAFVHIPNAKASFATKAVNREMLDYNPCGKTRIRFSLMPEAYRKVVDVGTAKIEERLKAAADFHDAGYEVHFNLSPIIVRDGESHLYAELLDQMNDILPQRVKNEAKAEIIFLTHNRDLHNLNNIWHPKAEDMLWRPDIQESKISKNGSENLRYNWRLKQKLLHQFEAMINGKTPWLDIRYAF